MWIAEPDAAVNESIAERACALTNWFGSYSNFGKL